MKDIQLSPHFRLSEFTRSAIASKYGIDNSLYPTNPHDAETIANLRNLCEQVLEPLRLFFNVPIVIGSGYHCPDLNKSVGGVKNSQHMTGETADIHIPVYDFKASDGTHHSNMDIQNNWMRWLIDNTDFDQCIKETANCRTYWIHVSCKRVRTKNSHYVVSFLLRSSQSPNR